MKLYHSVLTTELCEKWLDNDLTYCPDVYCIFSMIIVDLFWLRYWLGTCLISNLCLIQRWPLDNCTIMSIFPLMLQIMHQIDGHICSRFDLIICLPTTRLPLKVNLVWRSATRISMVHQMHTRGTSSVKDSTSKTHLNSTLQSSMFLKHNSPFHFACRFCLTLLNPSTMYFTCCTWMYCLSFEYQCAHRCIILIDHKT